MSIRVRSPVRCAPAIRPITCPAARPRGGNWSRSTSTRARSHGARRWAWPTPSPAEQATGRPGLGGAILTTTGLAFVGATDDGRFGVFETRTGEEIWTYKLPASAEATPITYAGAGGKQYVGGRSDRWRPDRREGRQRYAGGVLVAVTRRTLQLRDPNFHQGRAGAAP